MEVPVPPKVSMLYHGSHVFFSIVMGVPQKWMVYYGKCHYKWIMTDGTHILGNPNISKYMLMNCSTPRTLRVLGLFILRRPCQGYTCCDKFAVFVCVAIGSLKPSSEIVDHFQGRFVG